MKCFSFTAMYFVKQCSLKGEKCLVDVFDASCISKLHILKWLSTIALVFKTHVEDIELQQPQLLTGLCYSVIGIAIKWTLVYYHSLKDSYLYMCLNLCFTQGLSYPLANMQLKIILNIVDSIVWSLINIKLCIHMYCPMCV